MNESYSSLHMMGKSFSFSRILFMQMSGYLHQRDSVQDSIFWFSGTVAYLSHVVSLLKQYFFLFSLACGSSKERWPLLFTLILPSHESAPISCHRYTVFSFACVHTSYRDAERGFHGIQRAGEKVERGNQSNGE